MPDIGRGGPGLKKKATSDAELNVCRWRKKKINVFDKNCTIKHVALSTFTVFENHPKVAFNNYRHEVSYVYI